MRAPVAPSGWPSEMPPPFGLMSSQRSSSPASCANCSDDRRERLVHLDHRHVVPRQPGARERLRARLRVAVQHPVRVDAGEAERRRSAPAARARAATQPPRDVTSTAAAPSQICDELPAVTLPSGRNAGFKRRERLRRRVATRRLVHADERADVRVRHLDRDDLVLEAPLVDRGDRAPVRLERVRVELLAREAPLLGDHLGRDPLRDDLPALEQLVREVAAVRAHRDARHHLDARRDDDVELPRPDRGCRVEVRTASTSRTGGRRSCRRPSRASRRRAAPSGRCSSPARRSASRSRSARPRPRPDRGRAARRARSAPDPRARRRAASRARRSACRSASGRRR